MTHKTKYLRSIGKNIKITRHSNKSTPTSKEEEYLPNLVLLKRWSWVRITRFIGKSERCIIFRSQHSQVLTRSPNQEIFLRRFLSSSHIFFKVSGDIVTFFMYILFNFLMLWDQNFRTCYQKTVLFRMF